MFETASPWLAAVPSSGGSFGKASSTMSGDREGNGGAEAGVWSVSQEKAPRLRVLVIEPDLDARETLRSRMQESKVEIVFVASKRAARQAFDASAFDLVAAARATTIVECFAGRSGSSSLHRSDR
jgi:PleD family two-component response regulator